MKKYLDRFPLFIVFLIAIAFSLKNLREPDLWWQIRTGEWILENHRVPTQDIFSYTYPGAEWINVKWLSEVLYALITNLSGPQCVFLLQAVVACLLVFFLIKLSRSFTQPSGVVSVTLALVLTLLAAEYRINGRPEMFSHSFTVVFLYFLLHHRQQPSNKIYWLIPLQVLWTNLHEAFGIGLVLCAIFFAGEWIEYFLSKRKFLLIKRELPKQFTVLLLAVIASVIVNPNGYKLLAKPLNILGQVYENKYTTELFDFRMSEYWQWNVYLAIAILLIGKAGWLSHFYFTKQKKNKFAFVVEEMGVSYLLVLLAFFYLASTAYRNVIFFVLVFFPALQFGIDVWLSKIMLLQKHKQQVTSAISFLLLLFYGLIVSNKYYEATKSRDRFGLEILSTINPSGAANYIQQNHLKGKAFSDYLTSSYLLWKLQPAFKTFIDLRDLDVFPSDFFNTFAEAVTFPDEFEKQDSIYHFNYVVLFRPQFTSLHNYLYNESRFKLAFADAVACVYIPKTSEADSSSFNFTDVKPVESSSLASMVNHVFNPFYKPFNYSLFNNYLLGASYALNVQELDAAEAAAKKSTLQGNESYKGFEMLGEVYYRKALQATEPNTKNQWLNYASDCYRQSLQIQNDFASSYLGLGAVYFQQQNYVQALENFEKAIFFDKSNLSAYNFAAECCKYFVNQNNTESMSYLKRAIAFYRQADRLNPDNPTIMLNMGFLYYRNGDCSNAKKYLSKVQDFPGLTDAQRKNAKECLQKCGF